MNHRGRRVTTLDGFPWDREAERSLLGAALLDWEQVAKLNIKDYDFYSEPHRVIWKKLVEMASENSKHLLERIMIDYSLFKNKKESDLIGGISYIAALPNACPSPEAASSYARHLRELRQSREVILRAAQIAERARNGDLAQARALLHVQPLEDTEHQEHPVAFPADLEPDPEIRKELNRLIKRGANPRIQSDAVLRKDPRWTGKIWFDIFRRQRKLGNNRYTDADDTRLSLWLSKAYRIEIGPHQLRPIINAIAEDSQRDPLQEWLRSLVWDGVPRLSKWLTYSLGTVDTMLLRTIGRCWLIQAVARALRPGCKADVTLVLVGPQGARKSTALRTLVGREWFSDSPIHIGDRRGILQAHAAWIHEISELSSLRGRAVEDVKAFLSITHDVFTPPYGIQPVDWDRRCVFCGTTNEDVFLGDATGARRFWPVHVGTIDLDWIGTWREQLWAEARVAFESGEQWWLDVQNEEAIDEAREAFQREEPWSHRIVNWLQSDEARRNVWVDGSRNGREALTSSRLLELAIGIRPDAQKEGMAEKVGHILKKLGWRRFRKRYGKLVISFHLPPGSSEDQL